MREEGREGQEELTAAGWFSQAGARLPVLQRRRSRESGRCVVAARPGALAAGEAFLSLAQLDSRRSLRVRRAPLDLRLGSINSKRRAGWTCGSRARRRLDQRWLYCAVCSGACAVQAAARLHVLQPGYTGCTIVNFTSLHPSKPLRTVCSFAHGASERPPAPPTAILQPPRLHRSDDVSPGS